VPATDPDSPTDSIDGFSPRFSRAIALPVTASARIIEISAEHRPDPRGDAPIRLDLSVVSGINVRTGEQARRHDLISSTWDFPASRPGSPSCS